MENTAFIAIIALLVGTVVFLFWQRQQGSNKKDNTSFVLIQQQLQDLRNTMDEKLGVSTQMFQQQYKESTKIIRDITEELVKVTEGQKQVMNVTDQLKNLQDILKNPKQRGVLGEYYLEALLKNVMPPGNYQMQYTFKDGTIVDAVVFVKEKIIPIDSKFSLEN